MHLCSTLIYNCLRKDQITSDMVLFYHITEKEQCKLYCQADGYNFFYALSDEVKDGTPCNDYSSDICVHGKCQVNN